MFRWSSAGLSGCDGKVTPAVLKQRYSVPLDDTGTHGVLTGVLTWVLTSSATPSRSTTQANHPPPRAARASACAHPHAPPAVPVG
jgi:hypothetical protein